jgi:transcription initiation factor TFIIF subunit beta
VFLGIMSSPSANGSASSPKKKTSAESYGAVDATHVNNEVWMVRMPPKLAQVWTEAEEGTVLGELVFTKGGKVEGKKDPVKPSLAVHASEDILTAQQQDVPLEYTMEAVTKRVPVMHPFTRNPDGSVELQGTVTRTANLQMSTSDARYRLHNKNRIMKSNVTSSRFVKPVEANELSVRKSHSAALTSSKGFGSAVQQFGKRMNEANDGTLDVDPSKKRKYEGQTTQSVIFELFAQQPLWSVKEMKQASGRPEKEIRQVLGEIGVFIRKGEHQGKWELRSEFK